jgi:DNA-binding IclR family transcriptional regulator
VPIFDDYRQPVGAVTVMAPINRMPEEEFKSFAQRCREAADRIERKLKG